MSTSFEEFKDCCRREGSLDLEALDVMFIEPLKDLQLWWTRQSEFTRSWVNWMTVGLGGGALVAFLAVLFKSTAAVISTAFAEALGAAMVGIALGTAMDVIVRCKIHEIEQIVG
jgi:hypothetical protein